MYIYIYIYIYITIYLLLLVTSDIPPVSGNSNAIKRLSSVRYFPQRSYREELVYVLMRNLLLNVALQQESKQTKISLKSFVYMRLLPK